MVTGEDGDAEDMYSAKFLDKVRNALDVDDLSEYDRGSTEYEVAGAALYLLQQDWARRRRLGLGSSQDKVDEAYMQRLLGFLTEHPDKADSIKRFLSSRDACLDEIDVELLDEYLNAPIPTLGEGLL